MLIELALYIYERVQSVKCTDYCIMASVLDATNCTDCRDKQLISVTSKLYWHTQEVNYIDLYSPTFGSKEKQNTNT